VQRKSVRCVTGGGLQQRGLVAPLGYLQPHPAVALLAEQLGEHVGRLRQGGQQHLRRDRVGVDVGVELQQELLQQRSGVGVVAALGHPAALPAHPTVADVEYLHGHLERILGQRDHVGVGAVAEHDRVPLGGLAECAQPVAQHRSAFELEVGGRDEHLRLDAPDQCRGATGEEVAHVFNEIAVGLGVDPTHARRRALADVAHQARTPGGVRAVEHTLRAGAHREHPQQRVDRVPDRPRLCVGPEVARALALAAAADEDARELLRPGHRHPRVGLVVAVLDVEPGLVLLDPGVLELQRLELVADQRPFDPGSRTHHGLGAEVQRRGIGEVGVQPLAEVDRLPHVDHPAVGVAEAVHAGTRRDGAGCRTVARRISHAVQHRHRHRLLRRSAAAVASRGAAKEKVPSGRAGRLHRRAPTSQAAHSSEVADGSSVWGATEEAR